MGLRGDIASISKLKKSLQAIPTSLATKIANASAPAMTDETRSAYDAGRSVYGEARPLAISEGREGQPLTLVRTGAVRSQAQFRAYGRQLWCTIGPKYARYLIGRYGILPMGPLPAGWSLRLRREADAVVRASLPAAVKGAP